MSFTPAGNSKELPEALKPVIPQRESKLPPELQDPLKLRDGVIGLHEQLLIKLDLKNAFEKSVKCCRNQSELHELAVSVEKMLTGQTGSNPLERVRQILSMSEDGYRDFVGSRFEGCSDDELRHTFLNLGADVRAVALALASKQAVITHPEITPPKSTKMDSVHWIDSTCQDELMEFTIEGVEGVDLDQPATRQKIKTLASAEQSASAFAFPPALALTPDVKVSQDHKSDNGSTGSVKTPSHQPLSTSPSLVIFQETKRSTTDEQFSFAMPVSTFGPPHPLFYDLSDLPRAVAPDFVSSSSLTTSPDVYRSIEQSATGLHISEPTWTVSASFPSHGYGRKELDMTQSFAPSSDAYGWTDPYPSVQHFDKTKSVEDLRSPLIQSFPASSAASVPISVPPVPECMDPGYHFACKTRAADLFQLVLSSMKRSGVDVEPKPEKFRMRCKSYPNGALLSFVIRIYRDVKKSECVVECQRRTGCAVRFSSMYESLKRQINLNPRAAPRWETEVNPEHAQETIQCLLLMASSHFVDVKSKAVEALASLSSQDRSVQDLLIKNGTETTSASANKLGSFTRRLPSQPSNMSHSLGNTRDSFPRMTPSFHSPTHASTLPSAESDTSSSFLDSHASLLQPTTLQCLSSLCLPSSTTVSRELAVYIEWLQTDNAALRSMVNSLVLEVDTHRLLSSSQRNALEGAELKLEQSRLRERQLNDRVAVLTRLIGSDTLDLLNEQEQEIHSLGCQITGLRLVVDALEEHERQRNVRAFSPSHLESLNSLNPTTAETASAPARRQTQSAMKAHRNEDNDTAGR